MVAFAIGQHDLPEGFDDLEAVVIGHGLLDGAGEAHGVGGFRLQPLGLASQLRHLEGRKRVAPGQHRIDPVDLDALVRAVGARDAHQEGRQREAGVVEGKRFGFGGRQPAQEITKSWQAI